MATYDNIVTDGLVFYVDAGNKPFNNVPTNANNIADPSLYSSLFVNMGATPIVDNAYSYDGVDDTINVGDVLNTELNGDFTLTTWVRTSTNTPLSRGIFSKRHSDAGGGDNKAPIVLFRNSDGLYWSIGGGNIFSIDGFQKLIPSFFIIDEWVFITVTINGTDAKLYKNGLVSDIATFTGIRQQNTKDLLIGGYGDFPSQGWSGDISMVSIYNKALTAEEVKKNYEATKHRFE